jgi:hypothetical protein
MMMPASIVSRKTTKNTGTEKTITAIFLSQPGFQRQEGCVAFAKKEREEGKKMELIWVDRVHYQMI